MGAVIKPMVILVRPMIGSGTRKESGCMTKIVERKNSISVTMAKPLMSDIRQWGENAEPRSFYIPRSEMDGIAKKPTR
jgi:hypothetical protein